MPQIDFSTSSKTKKRAAPKRDANSNNTQRSNPWASPWGDDFGSLLGDKQQGTSPTKLSPQERISMIERVYEEVLGRKPDTRDINYYKYSTLSESEIRKQLLTGKEHKKLIEDGHDYKKMKERANQSETKVKMLESQNRDQTEEFKHLTKLLKEKNVYIQDLRTKLKNPYNIIEPEVVPAEAPPENPITPAPLTQQTTFITAAGKDSAREVEKSPPTLLERMKKVLFP